MHAANRSLMIHSLQSRQRHNACIHCTYTIVTNIRSMMNVDMLRCKQEDYLGNGGQQLLRSFHVLS